MANELVEDMTPHEVAQAMHQEVEIARDTALKAHLLFQHSDHATASEFMRHVDHLNQVLADLNKMSLKTAPGTSIENE
jgi:hypothetical protein